jgi:hypothetical protein
MNKACLCEIIRRFYVEHQPKIERWKKMKKRQANFKFMIIVSLSMVVLSVSSLAKIIPILGENEWLHIGDSSPSLWPDSVGIMWSQTVNLTISEIQDDAVLMLQHFESDPSKNGVYVNGTLLGYLSQSSGGVIDMDPSVEANWQVQSFNVPQSVLLSGVNSVEFEAGISFPDSSFPYDDFMLKNIRLEVVPEPTTMVLLGLGGLLVRKRYRQQR